MGARDGRTVIETPFFNHERYTIYYNKNHDKWSLYGTGYWAEGDNDVPPQKGWRWGTMIMSLSYLYPCPAIAAKTHAECKFCGGDVTKRFSSTKRDLIRQELALRKIL